MDQHHLTSVAIFFQNDALTSAATTTPMITPFLITCFSLTLCHRPSSFAASFFQERLLALCAF